MCILYSFLEIPKIPSPVVAHEFWAMDPKLEIYVGSPLLLICIS